MTARSMVTCMLAERRTWRARVFAGDVYDRNETMCEPRRNEKKAPEIRGFSHYLAGQ